MAHRPSLKVQTGKDEQLDRENRRDWLHDGTVLVADRPAEEQKIRCICIVCRPRAQGMRRCIVRSFRITRIFVLFSTCVNDNDIYYKIIM